MARILFMGSPDIAVPSLQALHRAGHEIVAVVTQPDKPKGRGQAMASPAVKVAALELGLSVLQPNKIRDNPDFVAELGNLKPDFLCVVAYGKILPPALLKLPAIAPINLHFSLLPKYRGASCVAQALIHGDQETGVSTILMDEGMDTGALLMQWSENILPEDTSETLSLRLAELGAQQLVKTVEEVAKGTVHPTPQSASGASLAPLLKKEMGRVDWRQSASEIFNLYRGLTPWPGVFGFLEGKRVILTRVRIAAGPHPYPSPLGGEGARRAGEGPPGSLKFGANGELFIQCGSGFIEVLQLKPEGKSVLTAPEFVRGLQKKEGLFFG